MLDQTHVDQVKPKTLTPQEHHGLERLDLTKGQNAAQKHTASTFISCPERSTADLWYWEELHQKVNTNCTML